MDETFGCGTVYSGPSGDCEVLKAVLEQAELHPQILSSYVPLLGPEDQLGGSSRVVVPVEELIAAIRIKRGPIEDAFPEDVSFYRLFWRGDASEGRMLIARLETEEVRCHTHETSARDSIRLSISVHPQDLDLADAVLSSMQSSNGFAMKGRVSEANRHWVTVLGVLALGALVYIILMMR